MELAVNYGAEFEVSPNAKGGADVIIRFPAVTSRDNEVLEKTKKTMSAI